ncbi:MAG: AI-2E family transporter [Sandaracinaceae bacterium]
MEEEPPRPSRLPSLGPVGSRTRRALFLSVSAAVVLTALILFREVLTPFALAIVLAYVLAPLVDWLQRIRIGRRHLPRWTAVLLLYVALLSGLAVAISTGVPRLTAEVQRLVLEAPATIHTVQEEWLPAIERKLRVASSLYRGDEPTSAPDAPSTDAPSTDAPSADAPSTDVPPPPHSIHVQPLANGGYEIVMPAGGIEVTPRGEHEYRIQVADEAPERRDLSALISASVRRFFTDTEAYMGTAVRGIQTFLGHVIGGVFSFFITLMLSAYMLITSDRIIAFFRALVRPQDHRRFDELLARIDRGLAGVVRGQLLIALVNGVLSGIGFWVLGIKYWPVLTLIATGLSIIPIFGAIISSVPAVIVGLQDGVGTALLVLVWIVAIHQLEANLLNPKIMGDAAKVHPVLVVFALLAGEQLFGIVGALLAVPILSILQSLFLHFREIALGVPRDPKLAAEWAEATLDRAPDDDD